ncbi:hypothetical protein L4174_012095 [Photobacterium sp. CCB-ST2H9]|uniref:xenobiotic acyltransferase family protein n=1 Tax=Photobacterium sp. CCB-ST2H9 TaxID=2912855 RepID=UPI0020063DA0|nr:CatB-related O-acetyltransferase [Photobacterium sp. CCB-ST2H9]UTM56559.1 hypothetical protein L4174_012095 [Photobacterium sp. CCB-ST2H9]
MPKVINSTQGENCQNYPGSILKNSQLGLNCIIGDFSRIYESSLTDYVRVDRNNFILNSRIGCYSYTGQFTVLMHSEIGKFCSISWGVTIGAGEHDYTKITTHDFLYNTSYDLNDETISYDRFSKKLVVGNDVWIGANSTVCRGVSIGDGAVIGANSVVTKDVPPYAIVAGCPAKIIKYRFTKDVIDKLLDLKWWDFPYQIIKENFKFISESDIESVIEKLQVEKNK